MTNKTIAFNIVRAFFITTMLLLTSCATTGGAEPYPEYYSAKPIQGRIVDGVTGEPVAGAAVLVSWTVEYLPLSTLLLARGHSSTKWELLFVEEAITDQYGDYQIQGWGPVDAEGSLIVLGWDPYVFIYKEGYDSEGILNKHQEARPNAPPFNNLKTEELGFVYNGKDIKLYPYGKKPKEDTGVYDPSIKEPTKQDIENRSIDSFVSHLKQTIDSSDDSMATMKKMLRSMFMADDEMKRIRRKYPKQYFNYWGRGKIEEFIQNEIRKAGGVIPVPPKSIIVPCAVTNACSDASLTPVPK